MLNPLLHRSLEVSFREGNQEVQTFPAQRADNPLAERVRLWRPVRRSQDPKAEISNRAIQRLRKDAVSVVDEKPIGVVGWDSFAELLQCPWRRWVHRDVAMQNPPCLVLNHQENVEDSKRCRDHHTKVAANNRLGVIAHKRGPALVSRALRRGARGIYLRTVRGDHEKSGVCAYIPN